VAQRQHKIADQSFALRALDRWQYGVATSSGGRCRTMPFRAADVLGRSRPVQATVFIARFAHNLLAFFIWAVLVVHVVMPLVSAAFSLRFIREESRRLLTTGEVSWRGALAAALVPAVIIAVRQAYRSWDDLRDWLSRHGLAPEHPMHLLHWPFQLGRSIALILHQTAGFFGWSWIFLAFVGGLGQTGFHLNALWDYAAAYFSGMGGNHWELLLALSAIPALLIAIWNTKRAYRRLRAKAHTASRERYAAAG
jgi:hypothetical protein